MKQIKGEVLITKRNYFDDFNKMYNPIYKMLGSSVPVPDSFTDMFEDVIKILNGVYKKKEISLIFPERFLPWNANQTFWSKVLDLNLPTTITTSDCTILGYLKADEWDIQVEFPIAEGEPSEDGWSRYTPYSYYGWEFSRIAKNVKF